jgi:hypothetical protein
MTRLGIFALPAVFLLTLVGGLPLLADSPPAPDFKEIYDLVRQHLSGVNEADLNRAAVRGLLGVLGPNVSLVASDESSTNTDGVLVSKSSLFDGPVGYIRVRWVAEGLDKVVRQAWQEVASTNKLNGLIIDLRFAGGTDYAAAAATADIFARKEQPLLDWGQGMVKSKEKSDLVTVPIGVLVNEKTAAAAEALAAALRETGAGLIVGSRTAGQAMIAQDYPLKNGERLRIATSPIQLGDGSSLSSQGVKPDIAVEVTPTDERAYYADAFKELAQPGSASSGGGAASNNATGGTRVRRPRFNEAELVRERRDGVIPDSDQAGAERNDTEKPVVRDPALARALDFLKGLSLIRQTRS